MVQVRGRAGRRCAVSLRVTPYAEFRTNYWVEDATRNEQERALSELPSDYVQNLERLVGVSPEAWRMLAGWAAETGSIDANRRQLALRIARSLERGGSIKAPDAERAVGILDQANALGYAIEVAATT